jgi:sec-independent protein translocase protein TatB
MFDFEPGKLLIIGIVALIVIGPKELPRVLRQIGQWVAKMRRMANEFQGQFMDAMHEADLAEAKAELATLKQSTTLDLASLNPISDLQREINAAIDYGPAAKLAEEPRHEVSETGAAVSPSQAPDLPPAASHTTLGRPAAPEETSAPDRGK